MMLRTFCILACLTLLLGCCKEPTIEEPELDPIIGDWEIQLIVEGIYSIGPELQFHVLDSTDLSGTLTFNEEGTGHLVGNAEIITCWENDFYWIKDDSLSKVYFVLSDSWFSHATIEKLTTDSLILDYRDKCVHSPIVGGYYSFKIVATN